MFRIGVTLHAAHCAFSYEAAARQPDDIEVVSRITEEHLTQPLRPLIVSSDSLRSSLQALGLTSVSGLEQRYGEEELMVGEDLTDGHNGLEASMKKMKLSAYLKALFTCKGRICISSTRLCEAGGKEFFLARPELSAQVAGAHTSILPSGFHEDLKYTADRMEEMYAFHEDGDVHESSLTLWAAAPGFVNQLHADYVVGNLLTHIEGAKRIWLFPPEQANYLYLIPKVRNWEATSDVDYAPMYGRFGDLTKHPLMRHAKPMLIDLKPGMTIFLPCGWAHLVEYLGPAASLSLQVMPDWLLGKPTGWTPGGCADFGAAGPKTDL